MTLPLAAILWLTTGALALNVPVYVGDSAHYLEARAPIIQGNYIDTNSQSVTYSNCYQDSTSNRLLYATPAPGVIAGASMTIAACGIACGNAGYNIFGVEYGQECYCSSSSVLTLTGQTLAANPCSTVCAGNSTDAFCGGPNAVQVYTQTLATPAGTLATISDYAANTYTYVGCYQDNPSSPASRYFQTKVTNLPPSILMTTQLCAQQCTLRGFPYSGTEYSTECWCSATLPAGGVVLLSSACSMVCAGSANNCGGSNALTIFNFGANPGSRTASVGAYYNFGLAAITATPVSYKGCYADSSAAPAANNVPTSGGARVLQGVFTLQTTGLTVEICVALCTKSGYQLAGLAPTGCFCDTIIRNSATSVADTSCTTACSGAAWETCGTTTGSYLSVYNTGYTGPAPQSGTFTTTSSTAVTYQGCYVDSITTRTLIYRAAASSVSIMTPLICVEACAIQGYVYSGVEFGSECWCGPSLTTGSVLATTGDYECFQPCAGSATTTCGGGNRISVYLAATALGISAQSTSNSYTTPTCYPDSITSRTLKNRINSIPPASMTVDKCTAACSAAGFPYAGLEYAVECWCDSTIGATAMSNNNLCNMPCSGLNTAFCGAGNAILIYTNAASGISTLSTYATTSPAQTWNYVNCYNDPASGGNARLLTLQIPSSTNTVGACLQAAAVGGYLYAGLEYGGECWVGNTAPAGASVVAAAQCSMACRNDPQHYCGNGWTLSVYAKQ